MMIVIALIGMLLGLLMAGIQAVRAESLSASCRNNLRQIGVALQNYKTSDMQLPKPADLKTKLAPYLENRQTIFQCPATDVATSYGGNYCLPNFQPFDNKIVVIDAVQSDVPFEGDTYDRFPTILAARHRNTVNAVFYDGRVVSYDVPTINPYDPTNGSTITTQFWRPECGNCKFAVYGLTANYYSNQDFTGTTATRIESTLHLPFGAFEAFQVPYTVPLPNCTSQGVPAFSAKFTGKIMGPKTDNYTLYLCVDNEAEVYINGALVGQRIAGGWDGTGGVLYVQPCGPVMLQGGVWTSIEIHYVNYGGPAHIYLQWSNSTTTTPTDIPLTNMIPN
jgi:prepilin-type processing-associated H-X9-DG protein